MKQSFFEEFKNQQRRKSDRLMNYFLLSFFIIGEILACFYDTWFIATMIGSLCLLAYYSCLFGLKNSTLYQYVLSTVLGIFMAQFIYQMHGMFEMHFFAFIGSAVLITYRNWKLQMPLAIIVLLHHAAFAYLQFIGFDKIYFTQLEYMTIGVFIIHNLLTLCIFALCGLWSHLINVSGKKQLMQSFEIGKLQEANNQRETLMAISENLKFSNDRLMEANRELNTIFNTIDEALYSMDVLAGRVIHVSVAAEKISGYPPQRFMNDLHFWETIIHPEDRPLIANNNSLLRTKRTVINRYRIFHKDKSIKWIESKLIPSFNKDGLLARIDGITKDITEKITLENKIAAELQARQKEITGATITAQEKERLFLGQELHDNINPTLAAIRLYLDCAIKDESLREAYITDCKKFTGEVIDDIRMLSRSLIPPSLGELGLKEALNDLTESFEKVSHLKFITIWCEMEESSMTAKLQLTIFRIVQEQINNILKHARALTVTITLRQTNKEIYLQVKDDGIGFDTSTKSKGVGLQNIISRSGLFSGTVQINSGHGKGCEIIVRFPVSGIIEIHEMRNAS